MNPIFEKRFAVFALLVFSDVMNPASYYNASDGTAGAEGYVPSVFDSMILLMRYGIYALTLFLIIARFKSVVRPAMRDPFLWALVGITTTSFIWSDAPSVSLKSGVLVLMTTLFGLYLASRYSLKEQVRIVAWALGIAAVYSFLYTLALPGSGIEQGIHTGAWRGPLIQKNIFARLEVVSAPPLLLIALNSRRYYRYFVWTVFGLTVALVQLSTSKTALIICITLLLLLPLYRALRWSDSIAVPFFITVILVGASVATWFVGNWEPFLYSIGKDPTLTGRTEIWDAVIEKTWERPWLGYGYQAFWQDGGVGERAIWNVLHIKISQAHNGYVDLGAELGLLGLLFFVFSLLTAYIRAINWMRLGRTLEDLWPITCVTFLFMYNQSESTTLAPASIFWVLYVAATLSMKHVQIVKTESFAQIQKKEGLVQVDLERSP